MDFSEQLKHGILRSLSEQFEGIPLYTDPVSQGLQEPCFFVTLIRTQSDPLPMGRHQRTYLFSVQYLPKTGADGRANKDCSRVLDVLHHTLETIEAGGSIHRGTHRHGNISDGVAIFFVSYQLRFLQPTDAPLMEELEPPHITTKG